MGEHRIFFTGDVLPESFINVLEEHVSLAVSPTFRISKSSATVLQIVAGSTATTQVNVGIGGSFRKITSTISATAPANAAGTYPIYIVSRVTDFALEDVHAFNYTFALKLATAPTGSGSEAISEQVGTYTWDGSQITKVIPLVGASTPDGPAEVAAQRTLGFASGQAMPGDGHPTPANHAPTHAPGAADPINYTLVNLVGTLGARPTAVSANNGLTYFATDDSGGRLARSNGSVWQNVAPGITHAATHAAGASDPLSTVTTKSVLDTGVSGQVRAGRVLTAGDFTALGLSAPLGLWNLGSSADVSGNSRALTIKGSVTFASGITGTGSEAAQLTGDTTQALYIDGGPAATFRIRTGSWGCWFRTAKRTGSQTLIGSVDASGIGGYHLAIDTAVVGGYVNIDGSGGGTRRVGGGDVADDRWHFAVSTYDGSSLRLLVDGVFVDEVEAEGPMHVGGAPMNVGSYGADTSTASVQPLAGRIDEAFITTDVLSEDEVRSLYAAKFSHALPVAPNAAQVAVRRKRRGAALVTGDFPTSPLVLYNFTAGALTDDGSLGRTLTAANTPLAVAGADGLGNGAYLFNGTDQDLSASDTGLPASATARSMGAWIKTAYDASVTSSFMSYGFGFQLLIISSTAAARVFNGSSTATGTSALNDGHWHFVVTTVAPLPIDGLLTKLYVDGAFQAGVSDAGSNSLGNGLKVGSGIGIYFPGAVDGAFICDYTLTPEQIAVLYAKGSQSLGLSPKNAGDHVDRMDSTSLYVVCDTLDSCSQVDFKVTA